MYKPKTSACMTLEIAPPRSHKEKKKFGSYILGIDRAKMIDGTEWEEMTGVRNVNLYI